MKTDLWNQPQFTIEPYASPEEKSLRQRAADYRYNAEALRQSIQPGWPPGDVLRAMKQAQSWEWWATWCEEKAGSQTRSRETADLLYEQLAGLWRRLTQRSGTVGR